MRSCWNIGYTALAFIETKLQGVIREECPVHKATSDVLHAVLVRDEAIDTGLPSRMWEPRRASIGLFLLCHA